jgi:hypothetical protein
MKKAILFALTLLFAAEYSARAAVIITAVRESSNPSTNGYFDFSNPENTYASSGNYSSNPVPTNSNTDLANGITPTLLSGTLHGVSGPLTNLTNGPAQTTADQPASSTFSDGAIVFRIDLGSDKAIAQFNSYSWHTSNRAVQSYTLYAAPSSVADPSILSGYSNLGSVDTFSFFGVNGGQQGVSFYSNNGTLGTYRYIAISAPASVGTFFGEFDVVAVPEPAVIVLFGFGVVGLLARRPRGIRLRSRELVS